MSSELNEVQKALENLEDYSLDNHLSRSYNYNAVLKVLEKNVQISVKDAERLLSVCVHDLKEDKQHAATALDVIYMVVTQIKDRQLDPQPDLYSILHSSTSTVLHITKTLSSGTLENIKSLCFRTLLAFPDDVLQKASENGENLTNILQIVDLNTSITDFNKVQPLLLLNKVLKLLTSDTKRIFVENGIDIWFSKVIPIAMVQYLKGCSQFEHILESLEMMTEYIVQVDYSENSHWRCILSSICLPQGYSYIMKKNLSNGCTLWQRIWIVFIKLLKNQATQLLPDIGTPINSMLPVVETAFKLDVTNRCRAFQCWTNLIDNFFTDTNEKNINKRIKLLIIPLKSNNAKIEETVLAKLECWWHLIHKFGNKLDKFLDQILLLFLNFGFGKPVGDKSGQFPGQISPKSQKMCMEALVEIVGHYNCVGCTSLPRANTRLLSTKHLVDNWSYWIHAVSSTIISSIKTDYGLNETQLKCLWRSFFITIGELMENNIRNDLVIETINVIFHMVKMQDCGSPTKLANIVTSVLILPLFEGDMRILQLFKSKTDELDPLYRILRIVMNPVLDVMYQSYSTEELITKFRFLTNFLTNKVFSSPNDVIEWLVKNLPQRNCGLLLWTCMAESVIETQCPLKISVVNSLLTWPFKAIYSIKATTAVIVDYVKVLSITWYQLHGTYVMSLVPPADMVALDELISHYLFNLDEDKQSTVTLYFALYVLSAVLKYRLSESYSNNYEKEIELFKKLVLKIDTFNNFELVFPILTDKVSAVMSVVKPEDSFKNMALNVLGVTRHLLNVLAVECSKHNQNNVAWTMAISLLKCIETVISDKFYTGMISEIFGDFNNYSLVFMVNPTTKALLLNIKKVFEPKEVTPEVITVALAENVTKTTETPDKFPTPGSKTVPKKTKKKETSIVNTVVENGEEYVVVKSNWKFNPRKLTENQKEKLQRKREDIPALYQDLSQSQDEFKLATWKTDSQDTTSTSSKSESISKTNNNEPASEILKKMPSSNIVPKIIDSFFSENGSTTNNTKELKIELNKESMIKDTPSPKNTKSPRMALKDRVFKNVRSLIEKSGVQKENKDLSEDCNKTLNIPKTPITKSNNLDNVVNSAPPMLSADRPSRVKRKPKKFEDSQLLALKRSRRLSCDSNSLKVDSKTTLESSEPKDIDIKKNEDIITTESQYNSQKAVLTTLIIENCGSEQAPDVKEEIFRVDVDNEMVQGDNIIENKSKEKSPEPMKEKLPQQSNSLTSTDAEKGDSELNKVVKEVKNDSSIKIKTPKNSKVDSPLKETKKEISTPKSEKVNDKSKSAKKSKPRKSRLEKELNIDMVEGHPYLTNPSEKRPTRRKSFSNKKVKSVATPKTGRKLRKRNKGTFHSEDEREDTDSDDEESSEEMSCSEDIIESSQDSTATVTVMSAKKPIKSPVVTLEKIPLKNLNSSQSILDIVPITHKQPSKEDNTNKQPNKGDNKDDTILPLNKTATEDLTENMDTEPMEDKDMSEVVILDDDPVPFTVSETPIGTETQEIAEADTLPTDPKIFMDSSDKICDSGIIEPSDQSKPSPTKPVKVKNTQSDKSISPSDATVTLSESACAEIENADDVSSPLKDQVERQQDFLNNTLEISPIKTMSPERRNKSPSPDTSGDYVVIVLSSPVESNGEPFDKCGSPEVFTEEKNSPDKRDQSPPRAEVTVNNNSPSSSLSLKKNRPQVRSGGRGAQMLGLCVPDKVNTIVNPERNETDDRRCIIKPARRNLQELYTKAVEDNVSESEDSNFLKLKRTLPAVDSSPSGPILKRKFIEITDDVLISPASKRKRVSFHDPPVSTTVSVQKYIEPAGLRSPQNSAQKRLERQMRQQTPVKSPKRLSNTFKLDTVLNKAVESFTDPSDETQSMSLDETPVVEIVRASELNDIDPICPELLNCADKIENIASALSSPSTHTLFLKAIDGLIKTVGDLAKMTELEISRSCIKTPKIETVKKILNNYAANRVESTEFIEDVDEAVFEEPVLEKSMLHMEVQTDKHESCEIEVQTLPTLTAMNSSQTEMTPTVHSVVQTDESGSKSSADVIKSCLTERPDFVEQLKQNLEQPSIKQIAEKLSFSALTDLLINRVNFANSKPLLSRILDQQTSKMAIDQRKTVEMEYIREFLCERFDSKDLILLCSNVLKCVYDKPA